MRKNNISLLLNNLQTVIIIIFTYDVIFKVMKNFNVATAQWNATLSGLYLSLSLCLSLCLSICCFLGADQPEGWLVRKHHLEPQFRRQCRWNVAKSILCIFILSVSRGLRAAYLELYPAFWRLSWIHLTLNISPSSPRILLMVLVKTIGLCWNILIVFLMSARLAKFLHTPSGVLKKSFDKHAFSTWKNLHYFSDNYLTEVHEEMFFTDYETTGNYASKDL